MSNKSILMISESGDHHVRIIDEVLTRRGIRTYHLNADTFINSTNTWRMPSSKDPLARNSWCSGNVTTVWYRKKTALPQNIDTTQSFVQQETDGLFSSLMNQYDGCRWISARNSIEAARSKLSQLKSAFDIGFRIPDSIVTNDLAELREFAREHHGAIVAKPIQTQVLETETGPLVLGTRTLSLEHFTSAIRFTPCYAQEKLKINAEMRVVMFGSEPHAFRLTPKRSADDLKQLELEEILHEPCRIDLETLRKIRALMAHFNLQFSAIDFAIVDDGEPVFLELNPNGQWLWLQYMTGVNLSEPFADFLCK